VRDAAGSIRPAIAYFVVAWLGLQALIPLRQYLIAGDARLTWEGLSFSWRLKSEWYRTIPFEFSLSDPAIVKGDPQGGVAIDWNQWHGRKAIFRSVEPQKLDWSRLPEIVVLFEPNLGERIIYNPLSGSAPVQLESAARARVDAIWRELYGRPPAGVHPTVPYVRLAQACAASFRNHGEVLSGNPEEAVSRYIQRFGVNGTGEGLPALRRAHPFILENNVPITAPFLVIEDAALLQETRPHFQTVNADAWKSSNATLCQKRYTNEGANPLVIYFSRANLSPEPRKLLPSFCLIDSEDSPDERPKISCDILAELSVPQAMHLSTNPFLLRRYARRVADQWEKEYHRRPSIFAKTGVSLNRRPLQPLVDPSADLAAVPVSHFRHNPWIEDLKLARIPRQNLNVKDGEPPLN
jgi:hypothetical protein